MSQTAANKALSSKAKATGAFRTVARMSKHTTLVYKPKKGLDHFVNQLATATPLAIMQIEREGVSGTILKDLANRLGIPANRLFTIVGVAKATAEKKASTGAILAGSAGQAAIGVTRLLGLAQRIADNSTADEAKDFDVSKWLGQWIELPQPALGGRKPADMLDTPTGISMVAKVLGAIESGSYL